MKRLSKKSLKVIDNRYEVIKLLGRGGMGAVYKIKDLLNNKILALKMLTEEASKSTAIMRFKNEFYYLTQLKHPNLCAVYDFGITEGNYYFTMDYVSGKNLKDAVKGLSYDEIYFLLVQVLRALQYIHSKGIIHYDIKPSNILIESKARSQMSNAKLMDFGLAGEVVSGSTGLVLRGTLNYIAPEMIKGVGVDVRADLYSFGVLLYELFTGSLPFKGDTSVVLLKEHLEKIPEAPRSLNPSIPDGLQKVILKLLEKDPGDRFFNANEVIEAINEFSKEKFALQTRETKESYILSGRFVGREKELERLKDIYHNLSVSLSPGLQVSPSPHLSVSPSPPLILITGESGIGKTRLLQEFRYYVQLERGRFFLGHCYSDVNVAYQPFVEVLRHLVLYAEDRHLDLLKRYGRALEKIVPELGEREYMRGVKELVPLGPQEEKVRLFSMVSDFIKGLSGSIVIAFEDLHWADEASLELLGYLVRSLKSEIQNQRPPILVCGTYRKEEVGEGHPLNRLVSELEGGCEIMELSALNLQEVSDLVGSIFGLRGDISGVTGRLLEETGGNPFFINEVLKGVVEEVPALTEDVLNVEAIERVGISGGLRAVLSRRLSRVSLEGRELLKIASVIGRRFDLDFLKKLNIYDEDKLYGLVRELVKKHILVEVRFDSKLYYDFVHAKLREFIYEGLIEEEKRRYHKMICELLVELYKNDLNAVVEELAKHYCWFDEKRAFDYLVRAGKKAAKLYANSEAIKYYTKAIEMTEKNPDFFGVDCRISIYSARGALLKLTGKYDQALLDYKKALEIIRDKGALEEEGKHLSEVIWIHLVKGKPLFALKCAKRQLYIARKITDKLNEAIGFYHIGFVYRNLGDSKKALNYLNLSIKTLKELGNKKELAQALNSLGLLYADLGRYEKALDCHKRALKIRRELGYKQLVASSLHNIGNIYYDFAEYKKALDYFHQAHKIAEKTGDRYSIGSSSHNIGLVYRDMGEYEKSLEYLFKAQKIGCEIDYKNLTAGSLLNIGKTLSNLGEYQKSLNYFSHALNIFEKTGNSDGKAFTFYEVGCIYYILGMYVMSLDYLEQSLKIRESLGFKKETAESLVGIGCIYTAFGDYEKALDCLNRSLDIFKEIKNKFGELTSLIFLNNLYFKLKKSPPWERFYIENEMKYAETKGVKELIIEGNLVLTKFYIIDNPSKAMIYLMKAKEAAEILRNPELMWQVYYQEGKIYQKQGRLNEALNSYKRCLEVFKKVCENIKEEAYKESYLNAPPRRKVFTAIEEIEQRLKSTGK